jgi:tetratricopeptide (TPR) repeat protein
MASAPVQYDEALLAFSRGDFAGAAARLESLLADQPDHFEARLALSLACYRLGDTARAIAEGHKAEQLQPNEPRVHTNLSLFYLKAGDKARAEHHGARARVASWRDQLRQTPPAPAASGSAPPAPLPEHFPEMPWKKKPPAPPASAADAHPASAAEPGLAAASNSSPSP